MAIEQSGLDDDIAASIEDVEATHRKLEVTASELEELVNTGACAPGLDLAAVALEAAQIRESID